MSRPEFSRDFFALQLEFAQRIAELIEQPLTDLLMTYTNFYIRLGLGRHFDARHPDWQTFIQGFSQTEQPLAWIWQSYLQRRHLSAGPLLLATFGCFSYGHSDSQSIQLHFRHLDTTQSALGRDFQAVRRAELASLFQHLMKHHPELTQVRGQSWLYQLESYRRLFPDAYLSSLKPVPARFHSQSLWGQFIDRQGQLKPAMVAVFRDRLEQIQSLTELETCFPLQILSGSAPVSVFVEHYGLMK